MTWRVARCLDELLAQWNEAHPGRSKASDGSIGDAAHQSRDSDHNPWVGPASDGKMIVTARDFTHDPAHGADADVLAESLKQHKDPRVKYVIRNRRIWSLARDAEGWRPYYGDNPHIKHVHVSVSPVESRYDDARPWNLSTGSAGGSTGQPPGKDDDMLTPADIQLLLDTPIRKDGLTMRDALADASFAGNQLAESGKMRKDLATMKADIATLKARPS
jgi:hypothetical protein